MNVTYISYLDDTALYAPTGRWRIVETKVDNTLEVEFNVCKRILQWGTFNLFYKYIDTTMFVSEHHFTYRIEYPIQDYKL